MQHWALISMNRVVMYEFDTNTGGGFATELAAARPIAVQWVTDNRMKVALVGMVRLITPGLTPPPAAPTDDPYV